MSLKPLPEPLVQGQPWTALAPMQNVTTLPFIKLLAKYGAPDLLFTEYFRVHEHSILEGHIVDSICKHETGRPVFAQMIGENLFDLKRTVAAIIETNLPIAGIDLNMGCPAPKIYKKNAGGGLLREPAKINEILGELRTAIKGRFTVKMRIGFEDDRHFKTILDLIEKHKIDLLTLHARTVKEAYRSKVHYEYIKQAAEHLSCPVLANGNITSVKKGCWALERTSCTGLMIGRSCIRNPWIFQQHRQYFSGQPRFKPTLFDVRKYIEDLYEATRLPNQKDIYHINRLKKFLNFVGLSVDKDGRFLHDMRRVKSKRELDTVCDRHLIRKGRAERLFSDEPIKGLVARPNCETSDGCSL